MPFHFFGPPPPHLLPIVLSSALAFAGGAYLMSRNRIPASIAGFGAKIRESVDALRNAVKGADGAASHMFSRAAGRTGNAAFDDYRTETLHKLESEAAEFRAYLAALRGANDRAEFETFLNTRKQISNDSGAI